MSETKIQAEARTEFGKGAARRIRRDQKVPAVLYGHGVDPIHIILPGHETMMALKHSNALLSIDLGKDNHLAIPKQVQRDVLKGFIEHVDLLLVRKGEKVSVDVAIHLTGEASRDALVVTELGHIQIEAEATHIPQTIEVNLDGKEVGDLIHAKDLVLPSGVSLITDPEQLLVNIIAAPTAAQVEAELSEAAAEVSAEQVAVAEAAEEAPAAQESADSE